MYSPEKVQQATEKIITALEKRKLKENSIYQYRLHYQELNAYIKSKGFLSVDESTLLEFLRFQYDVHISNLHARGCQRQFEIVRKRRRNFVVFRRGG